MSGIRDHALLALPPSFATQLPANGGTFYCADTIDSSRTHYKKVQLNVDVDVDVERRKQIAARLVKTLCAWCYIICNLAICILHMKKRQLKNKSEHFVKYDTAITTPTIKHNTI